MEINQIILGIGRVGKGSRGKNSTKQDRLHRRHVVPAALYSADQVADFQRRAQLQAHVLHHHVTVEQQKRFAVDFLWLNV